MFFFVERGWFSFWACYCASHEKNFCVWDFKEWEEVVYYRNLMTLVTEMRELIA